MRSYVIVGLICISLMISGAEHLFLCLGLLYVLYGKMSVSTLCLFFNQFFFFYIDLYEFFILNVNHHIVCKCLPSFSRLKNNFSSCANIF